ncbi:MAG: HAMP domain-containing sensor histidine kinase [Anaerovoracaceae bacterium]|nr:HAMP domain-containing sensor histidine kinase [Bacillota bacterium]HPZ58959.1 HAMP domain-containing sensor histidine kinase [Bacillota bacterium]HQC82582.1 HAMP domain-containing sensor histidine kinase [Bacillota bacterium]
MDIKSKSIKGTRIVSIVAFIICVAFFIATLMTGAMALESASVINGTGMSIDEVLFSENYKESPEFQRDFDRKAGDILYLIGDLKGEDYIKSGKTINQWQLDDRIRMLFYDKARQDESMYEKYNDLQDDGRQRFEADYADEIDQIKQQLILDELRVFERAKEELDGTKGFIYFATDGVYTVTNMAGMVSDADTDQRPALNTGEDMDAAANTEEPVMDSSRFLSMVDKAEYLIYEKGKMTKTSPSAESPNQGVRYSDRHLEERFHDQYNPNLKVYFAFDESYIAAKEEAFQASRNEILKWVPIVAVCGLLTLISLIVLIVLTGRKDAEGNRPSYRIDRIFTEIQLLIITLCFLVGGLLFLNLLYESIRYNSYRFSSATPLNTAMLLWMGAAVLVGLAAASLGLLFILSCVRNIKAERFLKNSLIYRILAALFGGIRSIYHGGSIMRKVVIITLAVSLLSATVVLAPVAILLILILAPRWVRKYEEIRKGVSEVRNGNLTYKIPVAGNGELDRLAAEINEISAASNAAIQNELKNQRLKTELISNVSHDLKTPLTSIITYIDLLKTEGLDSENAPEYLEVLDQKSKRLQKLTEDLFDAAKASSGAIPVRLENVDMLSLINQGLGEMGSKIEESGLKFIVTAQEESYYVLADGQLLWRVVENLLGNVLKYALPGSRVYIDLKEMPGTNGKDAQVLLEIKNVSKNELNISADELMERFKRGDESRTTEGSGLGLAIAKDLVLLQNGWFEIKIDGDLFKAVVMLPRTWPEETDPPQADNEQSA